MAKLHALTDKSKTKKQKPVPVKIVSDVAQTAAEDKKWRAQSDLRTLQEAEEIRSNKERMSAAKNCAKEQMSNLKRIK